MLVVDPPVHRREYRHAAGPGGSDDRSARCDTASRVRARMRGRWRRRGSSSTATAAAHGRRPRRACAARRRSRSCSSRSSGSAAARRSGTSAARRGSSTPRRTPGDMRRRRLRAARRPAVGDPRAARRRRSGRGARARPGAAPGALVGAHRSRILAIPAAIGVALLVISQLPGAGPKRREQADAPAPAHGARRRHPSTRGLPPIHWWGYALLGARPGRRRSRRSGTCASRGREPVEPDEPDELLAAVDLSLEDIENDPDPRRAVIRAYARMERALGSYGLARRPSETPLEYLARALTSLRVGRRVGRAPVRALRAREVQPARDRPLDEGRGARGARRRCATSWPEPPT